VHAASPFLLEIIVNQLTNFVIRAFLAVFFGILLTRIFRPEASTAFIAGLIVALIAFSYLSTYFRNRGK
jgi:hypothetical protein